MRPLQHKEGAGFLEEHVYMAGDHTTKRVVACDLLPSVTLCYDEQLLSLYAFIVKLQVHIRVHNQLFPPTILYMVTELSSCQSNLVYTNTSTALTYSSSRENYM